MPTMCASSPDLPSDQSQCPPWQSSPVQAALISCVFAFFLLDYSFFPIRPKQAGVLRMLENMCFISNWILALGLGTDFSNLWFCPRFGAPSVAELLLWGLPNVFQPQLARLAKNKLFIVIRNDSLGNPYKNRLIGNKVTWINGHKLETVASWSGRAAACADIYAFQTAVVESMSLSGCPACCSLTKHSLYEVRRDFLPSSPPIPAQKTSNKAKFGWICTERTQCTKCIYTLPCQPSSPCSKAQKNSSCSNRRLPELFNASRTASPSPLGLFLGNKLN